MSGQRLRLTAPLGDGEHPLSKAARDAARNGRPLQRFCADMGISFWRLVHGQRAELHRLANLVALPPSYLERNAIIRDDRGYVLRGQRLLRDNLRRDRVHACPACLREDLDRWQDIRVDARPYGRTIWLLKPIRTCPTHRMELVEIASGHDATTLHDFTGSVRNALGSLPALEASAVRRAPSLLEQYLVGRLEGASMQPNMLDELPFCAAASVGEVVGAAAAFGAEIRMSRLSGEQRQQAGDVGFRIACEGPDAIRDLLARLAREANGTTGIWNFRGLFQKLESWLSIKDGRQEVPRPLPIGEGRTSGAMHVDPRPPAPQTITVRAATLAINRHPKRLRKILTAAGHVETDSTWLTDDLVRFEMTPDVVALLAAHQEAMSLTQAGEYINAPRVQIRLLFEAGFIKPFIVSNETFKDHAFARADLDAFISRLTADAVEGLEGSLVNIPSAAKRANCSAAEIVTLILDRRLSRIGLKPSVHGYMSVSVDADEIRNLVRREDHGGLSLRETEQRLRTATRVVAALIDHGHLPASVVVNPVNRCPQRAVMPDDLERFTAEYGSLQEIAKERGMHFMRLKKLLSEAGVRPAFDPGAVKATFYRRSELPPH